MTIKESPLPSKLYTQKFPPRTLERLGSFFLFTLSWLVLAFGQPALYPDLAPIAASVGFCLFFLQTASFSSKARLVYGFTFFFSIQAIQLWWFTSHPFAYIWSVYALLCVLFGLQFALLSYLATKKRLSTISGCLFLASIWTLLEWSRLFWFSGFYFNLTGMYLAANIHTLQTASLIGVLGMSFYVMATNFLFARPFFCLKKVSGFLFALCFASLAYVWGFFQLQSLQEQKKHYDLANLPLKSLLVHAQFKPDAFEKVSGVNPLDRAWQRWQEIFEALAPYAGQSYDFILFPEVVVPFGSTSLIYQQDLVNAEFQKTLNAPFLALDATFVSSEDIAKSLSSTFGTPLIIGLEGTETPIGEKRKFFNSAFCFTGTNYPSIRYDKQVLVPMGEYVPFNWAYTLANNYGIFDSFTPGTGPKIFSIGPHRIAPSICYEETFSNLMRNNSLQGATVLVNLTDDYWFPVSKLGRQHFEHAKVRTVENGMPIIRACNYGISGAVDSLGNTIEAKEGSSKISAFPIVVSAFHYSTLYSKLGDFPLLLFCSLFSLYYFFKRQHQ